MTLTFKAKQGAKNIEAYLVCDNSDPWLWWDCWWLVEDLLDFMLFNGIGIETIKDSPKAYWLLSKVSRMLAAGEFIYYPMEWFPEPVNEVEFYMYEVELDVYERQLQCLYNAARTLDDMSPTDHL